MKKQKFEVHRTTEGTVFEAAFLILAVIVWVAVVTMLNHAPDTVPTHFGLSGQPDAYGSKWNMLFPCILTTVVGVCMMAGAYFPHTLTLPVRIRNARQAVLGVRLMRLLGLLMVMLTLAIAVDTLRGSVLYILLTVAVMLVVCVVFTFLIYKRK